MQMKLTPALVCIRAPRCLSAHNTASRAARLTLPGVVAQLGRGGREKSHIPGKDTQIRQGDTPALVSGICVGVCSLAALQTQPAVLHRRFQQLEQRIGGGGGRGRKGEKEREREPHVAVAPLSG